MECAAAETAFKAGMPVFVAMGIKYYSHFSSIRTPDAAAQSFTFVLITERSWPISPGPAVIGRRQQGAWKETQRSQRQPDEVINCCKADIHLDHTHCSCGQCAAHPAPAPSSSRINTSGRLQTAMSAPRLRMAIQLVLEQSRASFTPSPTIRLYDLSL